LLPLAVYITTISFYSGLGIDYDCPITINQKRKYGHTSSWIHIYLPNCY
jgi:hypothetical protein